MNSNAVIPYVEAVPEESRLVRRAKAGEADAFVQLYDAYGDDVYRYIYFRVMNDVAAETLTSHVFRHAWDQLDSYQKRGMSFVSWIYTIARNQVIAYYTVNTKAQAIGMGSLSVAADYRLNKGAQDWSSLEAWGSRLRLLTADEHQGLLQGTTLLIMRRDLDYLNPKRKVEPSPTFNAYTRAWLTRYLQFHVRRPKKSPLIRRMSSTYAMLTRYLQFRVDLPGLSPTAWRMSLSYAMLIAALLFTGTTARAQSALPGDVLYGWKRTSEQAWRALSPDPVGADIILANRRLDELIAVEKDPVHSRSALHDYLQALAKLSTVGDAQARARIMPALKAQTDTLHASGLSSTQFDPYLTLAANPTLAAIATEVSPAIAVPVASITAVPTEVVLNASATAVPTEAVPMATEVPTQVEPTATEIPTEVVPTATEVPTEVVPTATEIPTEVVPTATEVPPTPIVVPTEVPTDIPPAATEVPTEYP